MIASQPFVVKVDTHASAAGAAAAQVQPRGNVDFVITSTNVNTDTQVLVATGTSHVNGQQRDTTDTAGSDTSDTRIVLRPGDIFEFRWVGADAGTGCHLIVSGIQYQAYTAPSE